MRRFFPSPLSSIDFVTSRKILNRRKIAWAMLISTIKRDDYLLSIRAQKHKTVDCISCECIWTFTEEQKALVALSFHSVIWTTSSLPLLLYALSFPCIALARNLSIRWRTMKHIFTHSEQIINEGRTRKTFSIR